MKRILVIAPDFPYPPNHGGRFDVWERIKKLRLEGYELDLLVTSEVQSENLEKEVKKYINNIYYCKRNKNIFYIFYLKPYQIISRKNLENFILVNDYDFFLFESEYVYNALNIRKQRKKNIIRVHNNECKYFYALFLSEETIIKKFFYLIESFLFFINNKRIKSKFDHLLYISRDEFKDSKEKKSCYFPTEVNRNRFVRYKNKNNKNVLFLGNLFTPNNLNGLMWYIESIHNEMLKIFPDYKLIVAGNTKENDFSWIKKIEGLEFYDSPESLDEIYSKSSIFINPMLSGAGVKLKTLNAVIEGLPIVSTSIGVEGIGFKNGIHCSIQDDAESFFESLREIINNPEMQLSLVLESQEFISKEFDNRRKIREIFNA